MASKSTPRIGKSRGGRPSLLTPEVEAELFRNRELGLTWVRCCNIVGVDNSTLNGWLQLARTSQTKAANKRTAHEQKCIEFSVRLSKVDQEWIRRCETVLALAMTPAQNSQAWKDASTEEKRIATETAKWKLSHQASDEYNTKERQEITGKDGGAIEIDTSGMDVFNILLEVHAKESEE